MIAERTISKYSVAPVAGILLSALVTPFALLVISCSGEPPATQRENVLPERKAPSFTAIDQNGKTFNSSDLAGTPWIASFFFTNCETVCPALNTVQADLQKQYSNKVKFVSISTDPDTDNGAVLKEYAQRFGAKDGVWWMVHMPIEKVRNVSVSGFALMDPQEPSMHSTRFAAVDKDMRVVGYYDSEDTSDLKKLKQWISSQQ